jgi:protein-export membrane protein SecD
MSRYVRSLVLILALSGFALWVSLPDTRWSNIPDYCEDYELFNTLEGIHLDINNDCEPDIALPARQSLGLDLVGGLRVLMRADLPPGQYTVEDLRQTANNVSRRIDALGVGEATIEVLAGSGRILVELPGVSDPEQAVNAIQQTALLEFVDFSGLRGQVGQLEGQRIITTEQLVIQQQRQSAAAAATPVEETGESVEPELPSQPEGLVHPVTRQPFETVMTGAGLQAAAAQYDPTSNQWFIQFELNSQGSAAFGPYTATHIQEPMAIVLDGIVLSAPIIQAELTTGGIIEGGFTEQTAKTLALQLRSGALPIPLSVESTEQVGASLGQESINLSIRAGVIGVITVLTFMFVYYRVPGLAADLALVVFILLNLAVFKLIPITLTLPAITGFLIGIGTAVDGNILIFERIKEELRGGKKLDEALDAGFDRAWTSIRDSNISTIIICGILFLFGQTPGASIVSGFAVTLALGLVLNLFTAVTVTRTFLHVFVALLHQPLVQRKWLLGV